MKTKKPLFVQVIMALGGGCGSQVSKKENYVFNPVEVMKRRGFDSEIWSVKREGEEKEEFINGVKVRRFSSGFSLLLQLFLDRNIKFVHAHLRPFLPSLLASLSLKKCALTPHTYELGSNWFIKKFSLFFMKRFGGVIALTPYEREIYLRNGLEKDKVVLIPHAIDYGFFSRKPKKKSSKIKSELGVGKDDFVITSVSNFRKFKNLDTMLSAFGIFSKKVKKAKFVIVGINQLKNPRYKEQSKARYKDVKDPEEIIKKYDLSNKVVCTGGLNYKRVRDILSISDIFVNNSDPETMGLAVYEAAAAGVPLCLSDIGSFKTVFGDMVLYSKPRDEKELAKRYIDYYKDPKLRKKLGRRLKNYLKKWGYPIFIKKLDGFYSSVLG